MTEMPPPPAPTSNADLLAKYQVAGVQHILDVGFKALGAIELEIDMDREKVEIPRIDGVREASYERISKALRFGLVFQSRVFGGDLVRDTHEPAPRLRERKNEVAFAVEDVIAAERPEATERLIEDLNTRLEREPLENYDRPVGEMVQVICQGLGLKPDWALWADTDWAAEEITTHPPGSPYASWPRAGVRPNPGGYDTPRDNPRSVHPARRAYAYATPKGPP